MAISSDLERLLSAWLPRQAWFPKLEADLSSDPDITPMSVTRLFEHLLPAGAHGVAAGPHAESAGEQTAAEPEPEHSDGRIRGIQAIVFVGDGRTLRRLNLPLSLRTEEVYALRPHLIGTIDDITLGPCYVYDGCADPVFVLSYAQAMAAGRAFDGGQVEAVSVHGGAQPFAQLDSPDTIIARSAEVPLRVLDSRASESSVIIDDPENPCVATFFRVLQPGVSSAVRVPVALTEAGSAAVPEVIGWASGRWFDTEMLTTSSAPLVMLSRNQPGTRPAWREAVEIACAVDSGSIGGYNKKAMALGTRVGELHLDLAAEFGVVSSMGEPTSEWVRKWQERVDWALARAPLALNALGAKLRAHRETLGELSALGGLQRIHGELTLNQVVTSEAAGFQVVNFSEETQEFPKPAAIDLVALMRSIDYAAGYARLRRTGALDLDAQPVVLGFSGLAESSESLQEVVDSPEYLWSSQAQNSLLTGYSHSVNASVGLHDAVLRAVLVDRLLVEVVTELRNRPTWLIVPLATLTLLLGGRLENDVPAEDEEAAARAWEPRARAAMLSVEEFSRASAQTSPEVQDPEESQAEDVSPEETSPADASPEETSPADASPEETPPEAPLEDAAGDAFQQVADEESGFEDAGEDPAAVEPDEDAELSALAHDDDADDDDAEIDEGAQLDAQPLIAPPVPARPPMPPSAPPGFPSPR